MKVLSKTAALQVTKLVLFLAGLMDIRRGVAHTFNVRYSAEYLAGIEPISDSLVLMGAFGISNFLTGMIYFLILWKAPKLAPYILLIIPFSYLLGGIGLKYQSVEMESAFIGRYVMAVYLGICLLTSLYYIIININKRIK